MSETNNWAADINQLPEADRPVFLELTKNLPPEERVSFLRELVGQTAAAVVETPAVDWRSLQTQEKRRSGKRA